MNMEKRALLYEARMPQQPGETVIYQHPVDDEINLGELIRALFGEWKVFAMVMIVENLKERTMPGSVTAHGGEIARLEAKQDSE